MSRIEAAGVLFFFRISLKLSDAKVYEPSIRARLGTAAHLCEVVVLTLRTRPQVSLHLKLASALDKMAPSSIELSNKKVSEP